MKKNRTTKPRKPSAGKRIIASLKEAVDWVEGKDVAVRVATVEVPMIDVRATRQRLGLSQAVFAAGRPCPRAAGRDRATPGSRRGRPA